MNKLHTIIRFILAFMLVGSGLFMLITGEFPTAYENETAQLYMDTLEKVGFFVPLLSIVKIICGLSFATKRYIPITVIIFMAVSVNMVLFHLVLEPLSGVPAYLILIMNVILLVNYLPQYRMLVQIKSNA